MAPRKKTDEPTVPEVEAAQSAPAKVLETPQSDNPQSPNPEHHVNEIPNLRFFDDTGNIYQLDTFTIRGSFTLRVIGHKE